MPRGIPNARPAFEPVVEIEQPVDPVAAELAELRALKAELAGELEAAKNIRKAQEDEAERLRQEDIRRREFGKLTPSPKPVMPPKPEGKAFAVTLLRHYTPIGWYEVVGYHKDAVMKKNAAGQMVEIEPAAFIEGSAKPPMIAGVGFPTKVWAGTVIRLAEDEAKSVRKAGIGTLEFD